MRDDEANWTIPPVQGIIRSGQSFEQKENLPTSSAMQCFGAAIVFSSSAGCEAISEKPEIRKVSLCRHAERRGFESLWLQL